MIVLSKYKHVFGKPPIGGSKLRPMSIELKEGVVLGSPVHRGDRPPKFGMDGCK
jgi:hypothetical protein